MVPEVPLGPVVPLVVVVVVVSVITWKCGQYVFIGFLIISYNFAARTFSLSYLLKWHLIPTQEPPTVGTELQCGPLFLLGLPSVPITHHPSRQCEDSAD